MNIADKIISLSREKRKIFLDKIMSEGEKYGIYPLTPNQYSLWCKYRISEDITQFTTPCLAVRFDNITEERLTNAVKDLFELEEVFRYRFFEIDGRAYQYIERNGDIPLTVTDIPVGNDTNNAIEEAKHRFYTTPLKLHSEYPVKFEILRISADSFVLMVCIHHLISDAASVGVMLRDLFSLIEGNIPKKNSRYGSYALYMNSPEGIGGQMKCEKYWINRIATTDKIIGFPTDFPRNADSSEAAITELTLTPEETTMLRTAARVGKTNMHVVLSSIYSLVIQSFVKKNEVIIATTFFNRKGADTATIMGDFASIVPYVFSFAENLSIREYIDNNAMLFLDALDNSDAVFSRISDAFDHSHVKGCNPVYQTAMVYHTKELTSVDEKTIGDVKVRIEDLAVEGNICDFGIDLYMKVTDLGETVNVSAVYRKDLFRCETIQNILSIYHSLLKKFIESPELSLKSMTLAERSFGKAVNCIMELSAYKTADIECTDEYSYTLNGEKICVLNEYGSPVPIDFFGEIFIRYENDWFSTGKCGRIRNNFSLEVDEKTSRRVTFRSKQIDLREAESVLKKSFPSISAGFVYISDDTLILNLEYKGENNIKYSIEKELGFTPSMIYRRSDLRGDRLLKHQSNIISALGEAERLGYTVHFVQDGDTAYIVMSGGKAPASKAISVIDSELKDEKVIFCFTSENAEQFTEKDTDKMFIYRKRRHSINEEKLIEIWREVLGTDDFGIYDSFHNAGGDSMKIYQLLNCIGNNFDVPIGISDLFSYNTVHDMAKHIDKLEKRSGDNNSDTCVMCF